MKKTTTSLRTIRHEINDSATLVALDANGLGLKGILYLNGIPIVEVRLEDGQVTQVRPFSPFYTEFLREEKLSSKGSYHKESGREHENVISDYEILPQVFSRCFGKSVTCFTRLSPLSWEDYVKEVVFLVERLISRNVGSDFSPETIGKGVLERLGMELDVKEAKEIHGITNTVIRNIQKKNGTRDEILIWHGKEFRIAKLIGFFTLEEDGSTALLFDGTGEEATAIVPFAFTTDNRFTAEANETRYFSFLPEYPIESAWLKGTGRLEKESFCQLFLANEAIFKNKVKEERLRGEFWYALRGLGAEVDLISCIRDIFSLPWVLSKAKEQSESAPLLYAFARYAEEVGYGAS